MRFLCGIDDGDLCSFQDGEPRMIEKDPGTGTPLPERNSNTANDAFRLLLRNSSNSCDNILSEVFFLGTCVSHQRLLSF